ncbi:hypothetical protein [Fusobacterium varium]|jgi:hypothetical protein
MLSENKIFRIGIDKISLYNFSIETEKKFKKLTDYKENSLKEKTIITDELFSIVNSYTVYQGEKGVEVFMLFFKQINFSKAISAITDSERVKNFKIDESFFYKNK